ncbi:MAG: hypothetical protein WCD18_11605 [Thermosynechococcaceae cyanobacterium]
MSLLSSDFYPHYSRPSLRQATSLLLGLLFQGMAVSSAFTGAIAATPEAGEDIINRAEYSYRTHPKQPPFKGFTNTIVVTPGEPLTDPNGQILGCGGKPLDDYTGFSVALHQPKPGDTTQSEIGPLVALTPTELPDIVGNGIPKGITPNTTNKNPFALTNATEGRYSFLLDRSRDQIRAGKVYILVVNPPADSTLYSQRRIQLNILEIRKEGGKDVVSYLARSLDGLPIAPDGALEITQTVVLIPDADQIGLQLLAMQLTNALCQQNQIQITKSGDRASAAPGDTVIYRLTVRNTSDGDLNALAINDTLPLGFKFLAQSVRAELAEKPVTVTVSQAGQVITFRPDTTLPVDGILTLVYAAQLTPDALRGTGKNYALVDGQRVDNRAEVHDGPAIHRVRLTAGILSNCGTILGRVFEDRNFDGEQQKGEPGVPNAVVYLEDGNRITSDPNGLFSVKCALPGYHTGVLDPLSVPDYRMAPNHRFIERNSPSRLVRLAPGSMVRMNFGVMPAGKTGGTP